MGGRVNTSTGRGWEWTQWQAPLWKGGCVGLKLQWVPGPAPGALGKTGAAAGIKGKHTQWECTENTYGRG